MTALQPRPDKQAPQQSTTQAHKKRLDRVRCELADMGVDGMLVTNLTNVRYLSGFTGSAGLVLLLPDSQHFFTDGRYKEQARIEVPDFQIHIDTGGTNRNAGNPISQIDELGLLAGGDRIAFEADYVSVDTFNTWRSMFGTVQWTESTQLVEQLAMVKDPDELAALVEAVRITDNVFEEIQNDLKPGAVERELAARITFLIRHLGGDGDSFDPIVASGRNSAMPHAQPTDKQLEPGDFVVLDFGARSGGYCADLTRTVCITTATDKHHEIYQAVLEAQRLGIAAVEANITASQVDAACRDYITTQGYGEQFVHATGHGLGLQVHTPPRLAKGSLDLLKDTMVVTVEPGIYIHGWGGVRIEDDILVGPNGGTPLNHSKKEPLLVLG